MALENANYIWELVDTNPVGGDPLSQADDHMRMIKKTLPNSFPGMTAPWTTSERINAADPINPQDLVTLNYLGQVGNLAIIGAPFIWLLDVYPTVPNVEFADLDGRALDRTLYADLFALYGVKYGLGNGTTTFNIPDLRGYFMRVADAGAGRDPDPRTARADGANLDTTPGSTQADALQTITGSTSTGGTANYSGAFAFLNSFGGVGQNAQVNYEASFDSSRVTRGSTETRPKNINIRMGMRIK